MAGSGNTAGMLQSIRAGVAIATGETRRLATAAFRPPHSCGWTSKWLSSSRMTTSAVKTWPITYRVFSSDAVVGHEGGNTSDDIDEDEKWLRMADRIKGVKQGVVVSDKMHKTITVKITRLVKVPKYGNRVRRSTKLFAHDEEEEAHYGDRVRIVPCRRIAKRKSFKLAEILRKAPQ